MSDFFNYDVLKTLTGAVTATIITVQFLKDIKYLNFLSVRWLTVIAAESIVIFSSIFSKTFQINDLPLHILNGLLVAISAIGSSHFGKKIVPDVSAAKHFIRDKQLP